ncbi:hypothetical protein DFH29DRAFT_820571 [Suillus ampliporus]|nr:hypothetical protein DFH29DRAFT_820571 [Suillus ampliporus]
MASTGISLDAAIITSTVLEGILYGFSVLMFMGTIWASIHKRGIRNVNRPITVVAILLLILSTAHMVVDIIRLEDGLVKYRDTLPGGSVAFFRDINQKTYVIKYTIYALQTLLGDGVVIFRCYVVWQSVWVIILPSILWCGVAVTGFTATYMALWATGDGSIYTNHSGQWVTPFFSLTISTNLIGSGLLAYRIWTVERSVSTIRATKGTMMHIVRIFMDAAFMYSAALFSTLMCFICSNNGQYIMLDMTMPIISITFYMVLIRLTIRNRIPMASGVTISETERGIQYSMKPLQVHISPFNRDKTLACKAETMEEASRNV